MITPTTAPINGNRMNAHSCCSASVLVSANSHVPRLRAGLTDVLSTGIEMRWISVSVMPATEPAHSGRELLGRREQHDHHQQSGQQHLDDDRRAEPEVRARPQVGVELAALEPVLCRWRCRR